VNASVATLCARLDVHVELLDTLVGATQEQYKALLGFRTDGPETGAALATINDRIQDLIAAVARHGSTTREAADAVAEAFGLPTDGFQHLSELAARLPAATQEPLIERLSCLRSLGEALRELSQINHLHARRGLQVVSAWRSAVTHGDTASKTYNARGRPRLDVPGSAGESLTLNI
jgi:hypothetical protein